MNKIIIFSQSLDNLDKKNGFRHLKFGSSPNQIKHLIKNENYISKSPSVECYTYIGCDINDIYNIKIEGISLTFFNNQLYNILIVFRKDINGTGLYEYNTLLSLLERIYGSHWLECSAVEKLLSCVIWKGKKVNLKLFRRPFNGIIYNSIIVSNNELSKAMMLSR